MKNYWMAVLDTIAPEVTDTRKTATLDKIARALLYSAVALSIAGVICRALGGAQ